MDRALTTTSHSPPSNVKEMVGPYQRPMLSRSLWQVANSVGAYLLMWVLMYFSLSVSYWLTLLLAVPAAGFMVRSFIILHDCGHGSFFKSRRANEILGAVLGVMIFTPFHYWRHDHAIHHATSGDLDRRIVGDIWTLTVKEYLALPRWKRLGYRIYRNPLVMFGVGPLFTFLINYRFPRSDAGARERRSVYRTNWAILAVMVVMSATIGPIAYVVIQLPIIAIAYSAGVWLFYVQHQYEGVYWERHEDWDYIEAALHGSSFYKLPKVLQWFSGNIGFHHIHHLSPRIPNYHLEKCYRDNPRFREIKPVTLLKGFKSINYRLWDEERRELIGYRKLKKLRAGRIGAESNASTQSGQDG